MSNDLMQLPSIHEHPCEDHLGQSLRLEGWSLHQRLRWVKEHLMPLASGPPALATLQAWEQIVAPDRCNDFEKRLAWDGLSNEALSWAVLATAEECAEAPSWWPILEKLRRAAQDHATAVGLAERCLDQPFVHVWHPAAAWALIQLKEGCANLEPFLQLSEPAWLDLASGLLKRLCNIADQALWQQFNQRRKPGQILLAHLGRNGDRSGEPVCEAYDAFVADQLDSGYSLLLAEFPVLGRLLAEVTELWFSACEEMLRRLGASRQQLLQSFGVDPQAELQKVQLGLSDPHRGARAVAILSFGQHLHNALVKVVYKPRNLEVDQSYQLFLQTLNESSSLPAFRSLEVLPCGDYGFMEWVEHRLCDCDDELRNFYTNAGRMLAVLHILGCTDCHFDNLIANGDQLVLIDTETLFVPELRDPISDDADAPDLASDLQESILGSVLRSGLLPHWTIVGVRKKRSIDLSALGIQPPPLEQEMPGWLGLNSDGMIAGPVIQPCELPACLPVGLGSPQRLCDFVEQLCIGFTQQLQEFVRLRPLLAPALEAFAGQTRRLVVRPTRLYFTIQRQMLQPASLRTAIAHGLKLEPLSRSFLLASKKPIHWPLFRAELLQLERLDIPYFEHQIDSDELLLPEGLPPIQGYIKTNGLDAARSRLRDLDQSEINFQQQLIRGAIAARQLTDTPCINAPVSTGSTTLEPIPAAAGGVPELDPNVYREEAFKLGEELWSSAIRNRLGRPQWLGMDLAADGDSFHFGLIGNSLYSGASGIAVLFARLALASPEAAAGVWRDRAWSCFAGLAEMSEQKNIDRCFRLIRDLPFGISGSGGTLVALLLLAQAGVAPAFCLADQLIQQLRPGRLCADSALDVISGVAGLIGPLLLMESEHGMGLAKICGEHLIKQQLDSGGWQSAGIRGNHRHPAPTGLSHGATGMAAALARLAHATGEERFAESARRAIAYERSVSVKDKDNGPYFRSCSKPNEDVLCWCHGASGILLSRLAVEMSALADQAIGDEQLIARNKTVAALERFSADGGVDLAANLCCGVLGLTSVLRIDAEVHGTLLHPQVKRAETLAIEQACRNGHYNLQNVGCDSLVLPGLFIGKAGVALALIEAAEGLHWLPLLLSAGLLVRSYESVCMSKMS